MTLKGIASCAGTTGNDNLHLAGMAESTCAHCTEAQQMSPKIYVTIGPFTQYM